MPVVSALLDLPERRPDAAFPRAGPQAVDGEADELADAGSRPGHGLFNIPSRLVGVAAHAAGDYREPAVRREDFPRAYGRGHRGSCWRHIKGSFAWRHAQGMRRHSPLRRWRSVVSFLRHLRGPSLFRRRRSI